MFYKASQSKIAGFSLLEVLITSAIIGIVTAVVLVRYGAFNNSVLLKNQAFEIALAIRQAQVYSISIRAQDVGGASPEFRNRYGVFFDFSAGPTQSYKVFIDNGSTVGEYDGTDTEIETGVLDSRFELSDACVTVGGGTIRCYSASEVRDLSVTFKRPNFDAQFVARNQSGGLIDNVVSADLTLEGVSGSPVTRVIEVNKTGQITVQ